MQLLGISLGFERQTAVVFMSMMVVSVPTSLALLGVVALILVASSMHGEIMGPAPQYKMTNVGEVPTNDPNRFLDIVEALTDAELNRTGEVEVLTNGSAFAWLLRRRASPSRLPILFPTRA